MTSIPLALTLESIHSAIDKVCKVSNREQDHWCFQRAERSDLVDDVCSPDNNDTSLLFGITTTIIASSDNKQEQKVLVHQPFLTTFYLAYSTWDGRMLYLDQLGFCLDSNETPSLILVAVFRVLARLAIELDCARFTWQHDKAMPVPEQKNCPHETLEGVLTLHWDVEEFSDTNNIKKMPASASSSSHHLGTTMQAVLETQQHDCFRLRLAGVDDVDKIGRLVQGLADCVKEPDAVHITKDHYKIDGFEGEPPLFHCTLLDYVNQEKKEELYTCGMAFCYVGCKLGVGRFMYLEDLFIEEAYRHQGAGSFVMKSLAVVGQALNCERLEWQALTWNTPALTFYNKLGAKVQDCILTSRFAGKELLDFAQVSLR